MKRFLFLVFIIFSFFTLNAASQSDISISIVPYEAGSNVDMKSTSFPVRDTSKGLEYNNEKSDDDAGFYGDSHMVAGGGIYGIPCNGSSYNYGNGNWGYIHYSSIAPLEIYVQCSSDFNYVSQSHSEFIRPFKLYVIPRFASSSDAFTNLPHAGGHQGTTVEEIDPNNIRASVTYDVSKAWAGNYYNMWFDLILALPYDKGGTNSTGITIGGIVYPLIASVDYTASVTVYISWEQDYWIMDQNGNPVKSDKFVYQKVLTIPFSGYADTYTTGNSEINFSILRLPGAANINLNSGYTGSRNRTDVAQLDLLVNFGTGRVEENRDKVRVFLSSIADTDRPGEEFRLVHEDANGIATDENSFRYQAIVTSTDGVSQSKAFDGTDYIAADGTIVDTWLNTDCHNENRLLQVGTNYYHFHSFSGIVSIEVSSENDGKTMPAGRYLSRIYVHVVVDE